jgi:hypothetical protein
MRRLTRKTHVAVYGFVPLLLLLVCAFAGCRSAEEETDLPLPPSVGRDDSTSRISEKDILEPERKGPPAESKPSEPEKKNNPFPD